MEYTTLGQTGIKVSQIGLGGWSFGSEMEWMNNEEESRRLIERAVELGINLIDTANVYSSGESERIIGEALTDYDRDWFVIGTKVYGETNESDPNSGGLSRKAIEREIDNSLERLGIDTVDIYTTHRWDYNTPIKETLRTMDDLVHRNKIRYLGASSMLAHQFSETLHTSQKLNISEFTIMQNQYNLAYREEEREMLPLCMKKDIGVTPYSPLASGFLTQPFKEFKSSIRYDTDESVHTRPFEEGGGVEINGRVEQIAEDKGVEMSQIALAWLLHKDWVDAPIIGVEKVEHLESAAEAVNISLTKNEIEYLEEPYQPVRLSGPE